MTSINTILNESLLSVNEEAGLKKKSWELPGAGVPVLGSHKLPGIGQAVKKVTHTLPGNNSKHTNTVTNPYGNFGGDTKLSMDDIKSHLMANKEKYGAGAIALGAGLGALALAKKLRAKKAAAKKGNKK